MFYAYVRQLPMVDGNLKLVRGDRIEYTSGSIRLSKPDPRGFRAFVLEDKFRSVNYRIMEHGMLVEYPEGPEFVPNPEELKHTPFAVTGVASEVNSFLLLCNRLLTEYERKKSLRWRLRYFAQEPVGKLIIAVGIVYAITTMIVLVMG